jgi:hypothetical protein
LCQALAAASNAISTVLSLQPPSVKSTKFYTSSSDRFATDGDTTLSEKIFNITMAEIESIVEPDSIADDIWREAVALVSIHRLILAGLAS